MFLAKSLSDNRLPATLHMLYMFTVNQLVYRSIDYILKNFGRYFGEIMKYEKNLNFKKTFQYTEVS